MLVRALSLALALTVAVCVGSASGATSTLYKGSAQRLIPTLAQAGYGEIKVHGGTPSPETGTATYARFTCDLLVGSKAHPVRIALWPTGVSTFRWQTI